MIPRDSEIIRAASEAYIADMRGATGEEVTSPEKKELIEAGYYEKARRQLMRGPVKDDLMARAIQREDRAELTRDVIPKLAAPIKTKSRKPKVIVEKKIVEIHHISSKKPAPAPAIPRIQGNGFSMLVSLVQLSLMMVSSIRAGLAKKS